MINIIMVRLVQNLTHNIHFHYHEEFLKLSEVEIICRNLLDYVLYNIALQMKISLCKQRNMINIVLVRLVKSLTHQMFIQYLM